MPIVVNLHFHTYRAPDASSEQPPRKPLSVLQVLPTAATLDCTFPHVMKGINIVEAFPNAFLGVLLADSCFQTMKQLKRGRKFDWLYHECRKAGVFRSLVDTLGAGNLSAATIEANEDHEERAALVCLLTAAAVSVGRYTAVGEEGGGYFFLPPLALWAEWARCEIELQRERDPMAKVWANGKCYGVGEQLP